MADEEPGGSTLLDPDESEGLLHPHVTMRGELDELEEENIQAGLEWATEVALFGRRRTDVVTEDFVYELHKRMFGQVWGWAGRVRWTNENIGVDKSEIRGAVRDAVDNARFWREHDVYDVDEQAVRFHHRMVAVHPFPNGNGRHARMLADLLVLQAGRPRLSWGSGTPATVAVLRARYISTLRLADRGDVAALIEFARS